jgi:hypothetical protein
MKQVVAGIYTNFNTSIYEHGDMEIEDAYLGGPKGRDIRIKFTRI